MEKQFFVQGALYRCIKGVRGSFRKGRVYQPKRVSKFLAWFDNDKGETHSWPQIGYIKQECRTWDFDPKDIDPRLYFERVS